MTRTREIEAEAELANKHAELRAGMMVQARRSSVKQEAQLINERMKWEALLEEEKNKNAQLLKKMKLTSNVTNAVTSSVQDAKNEKISSELEVLNKKLSEEIDLNKQLTEQLHHMKGKARLLKEEADKLHEEHAALVTKEKQKRREVFLAFYPFPLLLLLLLFLNCC
jgi:hypothetical protein